jgi:hypothetical protein
VRARLVVLAIISASLHVIAAAARLDFLAHPGIPSAEMCATQWNRSTNSGNRARAEIRYFEAAVVYGWLAKERYPGCGVLFRHGDGQPWLSFSSQLHSGRIDRWDVASGHHWGFDSPGGGPEAPNAVVTADGRVRLIDT